ncbi:diaminopimelate epimerase [Dulcicalothrix desertica PCC 7102]|uniref:Diaminopimelate epimerase n=1 Tax=Dulcicalothrix desertica PCC 7102 TaxID=232991 RepID=A0A433V224_9CYAN|nr:diaminopimelate epimerase [Dulcicalothrix desertica]RUT00147.1 diaminopimelate epimerase [Dulcicalothrix desertica PCC 7102]TWH55613.1 diaminopimelate epimerase [Dulcicalothrix desertica PCC 7102]
MTDFYKYHALGNDYIVIDPSKTNVPMTKKNIQTICARHLGIGSDGILYGPIFEDGQIKLRIFNPDGSEAEKSGNGIRIFSKYLGDFRYVNSNEFLLSTLGGEVTVEIINLREGLIKVDMGTVTFQSNLIPVVGKRREVIQESIEVNGESLLVTCLSIGNPHCVVPLKEISKEKAISLGSILENNSFFPNRTNVQLMKVIDPQNIYIEIWERGAGYTMASGSSSCAAASAAYELGLVDRVVKVHMPGGEIDIDIKLNGHVYMTGTSTTVAQGEFLEEFKTGLMSDIMP